MSHHFRFPLFFFLDNLMIILSLTISRLLLTNGTNNLLNEVMFVTALSLFICFHTAVFHYKFYNISLRYISIGELIIIIKIISFSIFITGMVQLIIWKVMSIRLLMITWMLLLLFIGGFRLFYRFFHENLASKRHSKKRTLIIGAGNAGSMVARQLLNSHESELEPVCFVDDDKQKRNLHIFGIPVVGNVLELQEIINKHGIEHIIIAIPSLKRKELNRIIQQCAKTNVKTQILPMLEHIISGKVSINQIRDIQIEDLLCREQIKLNIKSHTNDITGKVILVTGAGGSIGSEICRQICQLKPRTLILLGHGENSIYSVEMELRETFQSFSIQFISEIADIQDKKKMEDVMKEYKPNIVYHAAAHKHVPLMERHPHEAVKNNIIGTKNVAEAAMEYDVKTFVFISTDKAVNPSSVMGASKRLAEMIIQHHNKICKSTKFLAVRFGNVLGSRGSVVPIFQKQIEKGGPVTVTHPKMERYFMTIPEAARLVIQAGSIAKGGEVFVLNMGEPIKIVDLAKNLIKLSGYSLEDIEITYTGIRPGEKLHEELLDESEIYKEQIYPNIYVGKTANIYVNEIEELIAQFHHLNKNQLRNALIHLANRKEGKEKLLPMHG